MADRSRHDDLINRYNRLGDYSAVKGYRDSPMPSTAYRSGYKEQNSINIDHQFFEYRPYCPFTMSRWQKQSSGIKDGMYDSIHKRFNEIHERIKQQILQLLNKTFEQHQTRIKQQLSRYRSSESRQFLMIRSHISRVQDQINQLLYGLKGPDYKRSISDTVNKNFTVVLDNLQIKIKNAMLEYQRSIGGVQIDQARIDCIKSDLKRLFRLVRRPIEIEVSGNQKTCGCCSCGTQRGHTGAPGCCCFKPCEVYFGCN